MYTEAVEKYISIIPLASSAQKDVLARHTHTFDSHNTKRLFEKSTCVNHWQSINLNLLMNMWNNTASSNGRLDQSIKLFVSTNSQL